MLDEGCIWEYCAWNTPAWMSESERMGWLNEYGWYGWELVNVEQKDLPFTGKFRMHIFKRQVPRNLIVNVPGLPQLSLKEALSLRKKTKSDGYLDPPDALDD